MLAVSGLLEFLQEWHNAVYVTPLLLGLFLLGFQLVGSALGGHDADGDADHDLDGDADVAGDHDLDGGHDVDADQDLDGDHDVDGDHDLAGEHDADHEGALVLGLKLLGAGRVPFMAVLEAVFLSVGAAGLLATYALERAQTVGPGIPMLAASLPIALVGGLGFARVLTAILGRYAVTFESKGRRLSSLVGETALVESAVVDATQGRALFHEPGGPEITVFVRTEPGAPTIAKGAPVLLVRFVAKDNVFIGAPLPGAASNTEPKREATS